MDGEKEIYARQGFAQRIGLGARPALVIVDFVGGFADPAHFGGGNIVPAIRRTVDVVAFARSQAWPVAYTRLVYAEDGSDAGAFAAKVPSLLKLTESSPLSQIVPELAPAEGELVIRKRQASAFFATELAGWLAPLSRRGYRRHRRLHHIRMRPRKRGRCRQLQFQDDRAHRLRRRPRPGAA